MSRVAVTFEEEAFIRERIERFSVEGHVNLQWQLPLHPAPQRTAALRRLDRDGSLWRSQLNAGRFGGKI
jgi:hypothetical protein